MSLVIQGDYCLLFVSLCCRWTLSNRTSQNSSFNLWSFLNNTVHKLISALSSKIHSHIKTKQMSFTYTHKLTARAAVTQRSLRGRIFRQKISESECRGWNERKEMQDTVKKQNLCVNVSTLKLVLCSAPSFTPCCFSCFHHILLCCPSPLLVSSATLRSYSFHPPTHIVFSSLLWQSVTGPEDTKLKVECVGRGSVNTVLSFGSCEWLNRQL